MHRSLWKRRGVAQALAVAVGFEARRLRDTHTDHGGCCPRELATWPTALPVHTPPGIRGEIGPLLTFTHAWSEANAFHIDVQGAPSIAWCPSRPCDSDTDTAPHAAFVPRVTRPVAAHGQLAYAPPYPFSRHSAVNYTEVPRLAVGHSRRACIRRAVARVESFVTKLESGRFVTNATDRPFRSLISGVQVRTRACS